MKEFRVDLHLHTCLSPCGSLEMSPQRIVETALERGLDAIAVTDHNSTLQCPEIQALGEERGLMVFAGAEVTTREEAHCVALFADDRARAAFQMCLDDHLPPVPNDPERFGDQVWVNARNKDAARYERLLAAHAYLKHYTVYRASDAHDPGQIGTKYSLLRADLLDFEHLAMAFRKENGHTIVTA